MLLEIKGKSNYQVCCPVVAHTHKHLAVPALVRADAGDDVLEVAREVLAGVVCEREALAVALEVPGIASEDLAVRAFDIVRL